MHYFQGSMEHRPPRRSQKGCEVGWCAREMTFVSAVRANVSSKSCVCNPIQFYDDLHIRMIWYGNMHVILDSFFYRVTTPLNFELPYTEVCMQFLQFIYLIILKLGRFSFSLVKMCMWI